MKVRIPLLLFALSLITALPLRADRKDSKDRVQFGSSIEVRADETAGDIVCIGCSIHIAGQVTGDVVAVGGSVAVDGSVQGDVVVVGGGLRLGPGAVIEQDATIVGGRLDRDPGATIKGDVAQQHFPLSGHLGMLLIVPLLIAVVFGVLLVVVCYLILGQRRVEIMAASLRTHAGSALLAGVGVLVGFLVLLFIFHWTGPLNAVVGLFLSIAIFVATIVGYTGLSAWVGRGLSASMAPLGAVILGAIVIGLLQAIPLLGLIPALLFSLFALGSVALSGFGTSPDWLSQHFSSHPSPPNVPPAHGS
jgi:cytoskeletal protein CcmA (bactofilin family)